MSERITATEAARSFSDLLNRVHYEHQTFVIVRSGEEVGRLAPAAPSRTANMRGLVELVQNAGEPDPQFAADLEEIQASQPLTGVSPWPT